MLTQKNKVIIYAQDSFGGESAKTGIGFIKYGLCETVAIVDRKLVPKNASDVILGLPKIPIYSSIEEAKKNRPDADVLLIGIAPAGGHLPEEWIPDIKKSISLKLNIVNGLHDFLSSNTEVKSLAEKEKVFIWDARKTDNDFPVANARLLDCSVEVVLTVGTDAAIGKMTVALELTKAAKRNNIGVKFIATGQTGMMISGSGIPIDAIVGDFMAGAIEEEIIKQVDKNCSLVFVEGQGSILHPAWSGVTLALFHGSLPHKLILCHRANQEYLKNTKVEIPALKDFISLYENISLPLRKAKVVGIGLNTSALDEKQACQAIRAAEDETGLPTCDVVRNTGEKLLKACLCLK